VTVRLFHHRVRIGNEQRCEGLHFASDASGKAHVAVVGWRRAIAEDVALRTRLCQKADKVIRVKEAIAV